LTIKNLLILLNRLIDLNFFVANRPKSVYLSQDRGARWPTTNLIIIVIKVKIKTNQKKKMIIKTNEKVQARGKIRV